MATLQNIFYNFNLYRIISRRDKRSKIIIRKGKYEGSLFQGLRQGIGMETINHDKDEVK